MTDATYSVEQSKQSAGSQTAAWSSHVSQFYPDIPPGIEGLHGGQRMLPVSEDRTDNRKREINQITIRLG